MSAGLHFVRALKMSGEVGDGARFQRLIIRRLTECLLAHVGDDRPAVAECAANPAIAMVFWLEALRLRFTIGDWAMVPVVDVTAKRQMLQIKELVLDDEDGLESFGLAGVVENKPVIGVTASPDVETLLLRIGGFDDAAISHDGRGRLVVVFTPCRKLFG